MMNAEDNVVNGGVDSFRDVPNINDGMLTKSFPNVRRHPRHNIILITGSESEEGLPSSLAGVMRLCLQKKEYPPSPIDFRICQNPLDSYEGWMWRMLGNEGIRDNLTRARIFDAIKASAILHVKKDIPGLVTFAARWRPSTNTTLCTWGEMTITLESVSALISLPVAGSLNCKLSEGKDIIYQAIIQKVNEYDQLEKKPKCFYTWWVSEWSSTQGNDDLSTAAFLSLWLSRDILDDGSGTKTIRKKIIIFAINLGKGITPPLASLFLGSLYGHLNSLVEEMYISNGYMKVDTYVHVAFLQAFLWEHFKDYAPTPTTSVPILYGDSRILRWQNRHPKAGVRLVEMLDSVSAIDFRPWGPVHPSAIVPVIDLPPQGRDMSPEEVVFLRSCIPGYVPSFCDDRLSIIPYNIDRAARQMGFDQGVPFCLPATPSEELKSSCLDVDVFSPELKFPFPFPGRKPVASSGYKDFWRGQLLLFKSFASETVTDLRDKPLGDVLDGHRRLKPLLWKRRANTTDCNLKSKKNKRACSPVILNSSNMQRIPEENAFVVLARVYNEERGGNGKSGNLHAEKPNNIDLHVEQSGNTDPRAEKSGNTDLHAEKSGNTDPIIYNDEDGARSIEENAFQSSNFNELVDEAVSAIWTSTSKSPEGTSTAMVLSKEMSSSSVVSKEMSSPAVVHGAMFDLPFDNPRPDHVLVGGFSVPAQFEELYTIIWKKHGHIATTTNLKSRLALVNRVQEDLPSIREISVAIGRDVSEDVMEDWKCHLDVFVQYDFNAPWFFKGFHAIQEIQKKQGTVLSTECVVRQKQKVGRLAEGLKSQQVVLRNMEAALAQKDEVLLKDFP